MTFLSQLFSYFYWKHVVLVNSMLASKSISSGSSPSRDCCAVFLDRTSRPSIGYEVVPPLLSPSSQTVNKQHEKMAALNPGFQKPCFLSAGFRAVVFFLAIFFCVTNDGLRGMGATRSPGPVCRRQTVREA